MVQTFHLLIGSSMIRKNWRKVVFLRQAQYISKLLFRILTFLSHRCFRIIKLPSLKILQLVFVNYFISPIGTIWFTTLNFMHLRKYVRSVVDLKCCLKWAANESDFCPFLIRRWTSEKWPSILFLNVCCVLPIYIASHIEHSTW